ncbi:MAG: hypothetical protein KIT14_13840 [bacterium]|nr:hypothetical protein [bacterium]
MTVRSLVLTACLSLVVAAVPVRADEDASSHAKHKTQTITLGEDLIIPSDSTMSADEVLVFQNQSFNLLRVAFIPPPDLKDKIRCTWATSDPGKRPPWGLFQFEGDRLVGLIPPGRFASVCSFAPGSYAFLVRKELDSVDVVTGTLDIKGTLTVK